jgi:hypothetical protein
MNSYLYAAALAAVVATPTMAAEQLADNQMDQVTAGWDTMPGITITVVIVMPTTGQQPFETIVNNQGVFITHQGSIDLATLANLPNSRFTVTANANTIVLSVLP